MENQLTKLFEKYPNLTNGKNARILEIMIETETNGDDAGFKMFCKWAGFKG